MGQLWWCNHTLTAMNRLLPCLILLLVLVSLQVGISYSHLMQWPGKLMLTGPEYIRVQNVLIQYKLGVGLLEVISLILFSLLLFFSHRQRLIFRSLSLAAFCFGLLFGIWLLFIEPINVTVRTWTPSNLPADWSVYRLRWHQLHGVRFALFMLTLIGLSRTLILSIRTRCRELILSAGKTHAQHTSL